MNFSGNIKIDIKEKDYNKKEPNENDTIQTSPSKKQRIEKSINHSPKSSDPKRCGKCNKKLKLTDIKCRCDKYFCAAHRYSDLHDCSFDYKNHGKEILEKQNPAVISQKVDKL